MLTSWSISPITQSTNNEDPSPPLVNTNRSSLKTQDQHNMSNLHKHQIRKNANQLYCLPSKKKNLIVSLTFSIHAYLFFLPSVLLQKFSVLSPDFPRSVQLKPHIPSMFCVKIARSSNSVYRSSRCKQWKDGSVVHTAIYSFPLTSVT